MYKVFRKQSSDWLKIKSTQEYIERLKCSENLPNELVSSIQGGKTTKKLLRSEKRMIVINSIEKLKMKPEQAVRWLGLGVETIRLRLQKGVAL